MELEQAIVELELLRAEELRAHNGEESALTEALALAVYVMRGSPPMASQGQRQNQQYWSRKEPEPNMRSIFVSPTTRKLKADINALAAEARAYRKKRSAGDLSACACDFCSNADFNRVAEWSAAVLNEYHRLHDFAGNRLNRSRRPGLKPIEKAVTTEALPSVVSPRITLPEVCQITGLSRSALYSRIAQGRIRTTKDGSRVFVLRAELDRYLLACEQPSNERHEEERINP
jgi:excisionase family DNA binding protein